MDTNRILADLRSHRDRLTQAITALEALDGSVAAEPKHVTPSRKPTAAAAAPSKPASRISPEGMARIIAATKARWARVRAGKASNSRRRRSSAAAPSKPTSRISPEGMARIIAATKARWARVRAGKAPNSRHRLSTAARKAMSEASKRRWAAHRKDTKEAVKES